MKPGSNAQASSSTLHMATILALRCAPSEAARDPAPRCWPRRSFNDQNPIQRNCLLVLKSCISVGR